MKFSGNYSVTKLAGIVKAAKSKLFLLDYDGTLVKFESKPTLARPTPELLNILRNLLQLSLSKVVIVSGRNHEELEEFLGYLPVSMIAEHGAMIKDGDKWIESAGMSVEWKSFIIPIMQRYVQDCPGAFIENKKHAIAWHYRNSNIQEIDGKLISLRNELEPFILSGELRLLNGNKVIEIANAAFDKGRAIETFLRASYDCILCIGDDQTDEDMFKHLRYTAKAITLKVGSRKSFAKMHLKSQSEVIQLLKHITL